MKDKLQEMVSVYGFGISLRALVSEIYHKLAAEGARPCIVNDRYIKVSGITYQLLKTRSKGHWTIKEICKE